MSRTATYSKEFLLRLILRNMSDVAGKPIVLTSTDTLVAGFITPYSVGFDADPWFELVCELGRELNLSWPFDEWCAEFWPKFGTMSEDEYEAACRRLTVGDLIAFIQRKCPAVSFAPLDWPGVPGCDAAGVFLGLKDLVRRISPFRARFAPSTPVAQTIRGSTLWEMWEQIAVLSEARVPLPPASQLKLGGWCYILAVLSAMMGFVAECGQSGWGWLLLGMLCGFGWFVLGKCLRESAVPLPPGVRTWGDLARYLTPLWPGTHEAAR